MQQWNPCFHESSISFVNITCCFIPQSPKHLDLLGHLVRWTKENSENFSIIGPPLLSLKALPRKIRQSWAPNSCHQGSILGIKKKWTVQMEMFSGRSVPSYQQIHGDEPFRFSKGHLWEIPSTLGDTLNWGGLQILQQAVHILKGLRPGDDDTMRGLRSSSFRMPMVSGLICPHLEVMDLMEVMTQTGFKRSQSNNKNTLLHGS